jgi:hypothetical protein
VPTAKPQDEGSGRAFGVKRDIVARSGLEDIHSGIVNPESMKVPGQRSGGDVKN